MSKTKDITYKIVDDSDKQYTIVECPVLKENITIHPRVLKAGTIKDDIFSVSSEDDYVKRHLHAIRCQCKKCRGLMSQLIDTIVDSNAPVVITDTSKFK